VSQPAAVGVQPVAVVHAAEGQMVFFTQLLPSEHFASQLHEEPHRTPLGQPPAEQSTEQDPGPQVTPVLQALAPQVAVHADDKLQSIFPLHALVPQVTAQGPAPHLTPVEHDPTPQSTVHVADLVQSMRALHVPSLQFT
jgi:hypothetical protein